MKKKKVKLTSPQTLSLLGGAFILACATVVFFFVTHGGLTKDLKEANKIIEARESTIESLETTLSEANNTNNNLSEALDSEQRKNAEFFDQIEDITDTVGTLDKLARTDPELLQKYSKVYFLNEHYAPPKLTDIDEEWLYRPERKTQIHAQVWPHLEDMLEEAEVDDIELVVVSAFRSFDDQHSLKSAYTVTYGSGANAFSADQGYSEHQLGTTVDFTVSRESTPFRTFQDTESYEWLLDNAHKYGFTLSYPEENSFYIFEPWHWRYVGENLARDLKRKDKFFYDLTQREIDEYLVDLFE